MSLKDFSVKDKVVIITGSSQGIGHRLATGFAEEGAKVVVNSRKYEKLKPLIEEIEKTGGEVLPVQADMREYDDVVALMKKANERFGRIDLLINNAGGSFGHSLDELSPNAFSAITRNNLDQVFNCCAAVRPFMAEQDGGRIINVSSMAGIRPSPGLGAYGAAKAGVISLTETLALEWSKYNILVNCIAPGLIVTEGTKDVLIPTEKKEQEYRNKIPVGRIGVPEDILNACLYLASEASSYITAETIKVEGGPRQG
ncbi:glucose 1-dehydrogenase [Salicibibacter cibarius]|uniref:Glucose 1-dehydrogenase n=1 Tax=Salicibibacter cibarius TaxID=2743000 RepID=A0A7T6Z3P1_9BACI|nr:glucose 1-dehydrogenase [Salicibibacter cibarius]QQK76440.1 glucose 1-dehydrogenase [Salicibibacter cibarius]